MPQSLADLAYRTVANVVGGPVDIATMVMRPFGYSTPEQQVVGGSEWIGKKMEQAGLVSPERAPIRELVASLLTPNPAAVASKAMFIGGLAKTWNAGAAAKAKELEQLGVDARKIWQETGTWRGPDGKWRQEISDKPAQITEDVYQGIKANQRFEGSMQQALTHPELYKAYPETAKIGSGFYAWPTPEGTYQATSRTITAGGPGTTSQKSAALHELQHDIQQSEGFARGGSPESMPLMLETLAEQKRNQARALFEQSARNDPLAPGEIVKPGARIKALEAEKQAREYEALKNRINEFGAGYANEAYRRLAGEAEARATQARMNMTPEQRLATFPEESYDVPIKNLLFIK